MAMMATMAMDVSVDARPYYDTYKSIATTTLPIRQPSRAKLPDLPPSIMSLNIQRQQVVSVSKPRPPPAIIEEAVPARPTSFPVANANVEELIQGLNFILSPSASGNPNLAADILTWVCLFDNLIRSSSLVAPLDGATFLDLIILMNEQLETAADDRRRIFYDTTSKAGIDGTLQRLFKASRSVRLEKEVEDFEDAREEWLAVG